MLINYYKKNKINKIRFYNNKLKILIIILNNKKYNFKNK